MNVEVTAHELPSTYITDAFDAISGYEETLVAQGEAMGIERGRSLGIEEGHELGCAVSISRTKDGKRIGLCYYSIRLMKGAEIGSELGFYQGCYLVWNHMLKHETLQCKLPCVSNRHCQKCSLGRRH